ncbi:MAG: protein TolR [Alphaproteobacteria bacterium]|nr:protein TolR [Alphaproteobacteria bacterium]MCB9792599.1 protein TolR [Alphaproteobacteria bacterium]
MGMSTGGDRGGMMAEINVTPFVDVMLVLLIIFMVTAPMMVQGLEVDLPRAEAPPLESADDQLLLILDKEGRVFIKSGEEAREVPADQLPQRLAAIKESNPDQAVFVQADGALPYADVMRLMAAAKAAGIGKVGLVTQPEDG